MYKLTETPPVTDSGSPKSRVDNFQTYDPRMVMAWNEYVAPIKLYERPHDIRMDLWNAFKAGWEAK